MEILAHLHPPIVHFAVALTISGILLDAAAFFLKKEEPRSAALYTFVLGALAMAAALVTGENAADLAEHATPAAFETAHDLFEIHEELGEVLVWIALALAGLRIFLRFKPQLLKLWIIFLVLGGLYAGMVGYQGKIGGVLVYQYGLNVTPAN